MSSKRFFSSSIMIFLTIAAVLNRWFFILFVMVLTIGGLYEFFYLVKKKGIPIYSYVGIFLEWWFQRRSIPALNRPKIGNCFLSSLHFCWFYFCSLPGRIIAMRLLEFQPHSSVCFMFPGLLVFWLRLDFNCFLDQSWPE